MDEARANALGLAPVQQELGLIDAIQTLPDVVQVSFALRPVGVDTFFDVLVGQDERQSDLMAVHLEQGGLGLPERDYYFNPEKGTAQVRQEYVAHLGRMLKLMGRPEAAARSAAVQVMKFETALAKASRKLEDLRDPEKNYHKMSPATLTRKHTPLINWTNYLASAVAASGRGDRWAAGIFYGPESFAETDAAVGPEGLYAPPFGIRLRGVPGPGVG